MKRWNNYKIKLKSYILIKGSIIGLTNTNVFHLVLGGTYEVGDFNRRSSCTKSGK